MCGIAGGTGRDSAERRRTLASQLETMRRRGPDASGFIPGARGSVGQSRLAVIDVEHGDPPLTDESGMLRVALNGEIYNYRTLMNELVDGGHSFSSACDTEVIAHLAEELDAATLCRRLDGMFAFALWNELDGTLVLARDRVGKKPLYYWYGDGELVFGSEMKAVLADPRVPRRFSPAAVPSYLLHGYVPTPETFWDGVRSVPPGCVLEFRSGGPPSIQRYWDVPLVLDRGLLRDEPFEVLARQLLELLRSAVGRRLVADVPVGAFLSGGVDSSAVVALMAEQMDRPVRTFSIGFEEPRFDERRWGRIIAERFGTEHVEHVVRPDASLLVDEILQACDQPFADSSALPMWLLSQATREHVTVALSGDGGDELFAGYERFAAGLAFGRHARMLSRLAPARRLAGHPRVPEKVTRLLEAAPAGMLDGYLRLVSILSPEQVDSLVPGGGTRALRQHDDVWAESAGAEPLARLLHLNLRTYLLDDLLVKTDRMSMRHGLEVRSPLLDPALLEFALSIPQRHQLRGRTLKRLLKAAVRDHVPAEILDRPKKGFGVPLDAWFRGELRDEARGMLLAPNARVYDHLKGAAVVRLVEEHDTGVRDHGQRLWALLLLERFLRDVA